MLTEKGISDASLCPRLLLEPEHKHHRVIEDKKDFVLQELLEMFRTHKDGKYTTIEEDFLGGWVLYRTSGGKFWFCCPSEHGSFLLCVDQIMIDDEGMITFYRDKSFMYRTDEHLLTEEMARNLLHAFIAFRCEEPFTVLTTLNDDSQYSTEGLRESDIDASQRQAEKLFEIAQNPLDFPAKTENCPKCPWKTCPYRQDRTPVPPGHGFAWKM